MNNIEKNSARFARAPGAQKVVLGRIQLLLKAPFIVLKSHKTDVYGRYVADVFYHPELDDKREIAEKGFFLNEDLLKSGLTEGYEV